MSKLNNDVLYLIFQELQDYKNSLRSCLFVNKSWCRIVIPILWKNPWNLKEGEEELLFNVIISHLSDESKSNLKSQGINFSYQQRPLFDYISFCRHLNLSEIERIIHSIYIYHKHKLSIIENEIFNLFINGNTKFTHLYINDQIKVFSGAKRCFQELEFLSCNTSM